MDAELLRRRTLQHFERLRNAGDAMKDDVQAGRDPSRTFLAQHIGGRARRSTAADAPKRPAKKNEAQRLVMVEAVRSACVPLILHFVDEERLARNGTGFVFLSSAPPTVSDLKACDVTKRRSTREAPVAGGFFSSVFRIGAHDLGDRAGVDPAEARKKGGREREYSVKVVVMEENRFDSVNAQIRRWRKETNMAKRAGALGVGPRVHAAFVCRRATDDGVRTLGIQVSDHISGTTLAKWNASAAPEDVRLANRLAFDKLSELHDAGIRHGDLHAGNVLVVPERPPLQGVKDVFLIDFGFSERCRGAQATDLLDLQNLVDGREPRLPPLEERIFDALVAEGTIRF